MLFSRVRPEKQAVYSSPISNLAGNFFLALLASLKRVCSSQVQAIYIFCRQFQQLLLAIVYKLLLTATKSKIASAP